MVILDIFFASKNTCVFHGHFVLVTASPQELSHEKVIPHHGD